MREWLKVYCRFCNQPMGDYKYFPPDCECEGYQAARNQWLEERKNDPNYQEPLEPEDYDKKYPQTYNGSRTVQDKDGQHKISLEARRYDDGEGLCVWIPFATDEDEEEPSAGLCWDFTDGDAVALHEMLGEYLEKKNGNS